MCSDSMETHGLLEQAAVRDPAAVNRLLDRHREPLRRMIALRLDRAIAPRVDASDIVQTVLFEASQRLCDYLKNPAIPFHLWLRRIAQDHVIDAERRHRKALRRSLDREQPLTAAYTDRSSLDLAAQLRDPQLTPAALALQRELERRFRSALDELDHDDKEVLIMRHFEQLSNSEVAEILGLTEAGAGMRYIRALRRLRKLLEETPSRRGVE
jgi:RNA polymerase sigma-70 factor (ECF subfamily)